MTTVPVMEPIFEQTWMDDAACKNMGDLFFPTRGFDAKDTIELCKAVCDKCPVFDQCKRWALTLSGNVPGVYAGMSTRERRKERLALKISKPRERPVGYENGRPRDSH